MVVVNCWDKLCTLGRAPHTTETLPDFHKWCRVTRHPRIFRRLTGCQRDTPVLGRHRNKLKIHTKPKPIQNPKIHTFISLLYLLLPLLILLFLSLFFSSSRFALANNETKMRCCLSHPPFSSFNSPFISIRSSLSQVFANQLLLFL